jgi:hypothetical protein
MSPGRLGKAYFRPISNHVIAKTIASQFQGPICRWSLMLKFERAPGWRRLSKDLIDGA